ncbi:MAG: hypothetical protein PHR30_07465 [Gallionellaceae bacterium]|nr:hypothetical protein [Gallionellaceae bacterium]MDD5365160.1 hypothetical protein [Gallionellaceae bacterium]
MDKRVMLSIMLALAATAVQAARPQAADCRADEMNAFSTLPMLVPAGRGDRAGAAYCLANVRTEAVEVRNGAGGFAPPAALAVAAGGFKVNPGKVGNYHWLQAGEASQTGVITASTVHYFANPGPAPTAMLHLAKAELEIVPQPLPREHWHYRAGETWAFLVRFHDEPVKDTGVRLETSGGTQQVFRTDGEGIVRVTFPADVADEAPKGGHDHGRGGENRFVLAVGLTDQDGRYYLTGFNQVYGAAADAGRSLPYGLGFLALGGLAAVPLAIRRKESKHG